MSADGVSRAGGHMRAELVSQPEMWTRAIALTDQFTALPPSGARVAVIGCGTSWFMGQSYAVLRESAGQGETDAFAASESPLALRDYDVVVALTRSGTTTEVLDVLSQLRGSTRLVGIVGDPYSPLCDVVDELIALPFADEHSIVQTRFATTAVAFLRASLGEDLHRVIDEARTAIDGELDPVLLEAEQYSFLGRGWTVGLAHEAALKMREASQSWTESYSAKEYRHGPISIASPGRVVWSLDPVDEKLKLAVEAAGAHVESAELDPLAELIRVQRVALERSLRKGLDADHPRNLTRSVILEPQS
jgi:fructoselysine-6-P-deglycase FrlB-like protein